MAPDNPITKVLCIVWAPHSARMEELSSEIPGKKAIFTVLYGHMYLAPLRYFFLFFKTIFLLVKERPDVVYAQNPSIFCPMSCLPYCWVRHKKLVIDHHAVWSMKTFSKGVLGKIIRSLEKYAVSKAYANTAPHPLWSIELEKLGAKNVLTVFDYVKESTVPRDDSVHAKYAQGNTFLALAPHGGHPLESIESEAQAAGSISSLTLLISGPPSKMQSRLSSIRFPSNVHYIGFLPKEEFEKLKASVDLGLCITEEPYTISHSLLEFAAVSIPTISSEQEAVKILFGDSLVYVKSSAAEEVRSKIESMLNNPEMRKEYSARIKKREQELEFQRAKEIEALRTLLYS